MLHSIHASEAGAKAVSFIEDAVLSIDDIAPLPGCTGRILEAIDKQRDFQTIGALVSTDAVLSGNVLRMANSPIFGGLSRTSSVAQAVSRVGLKTLRSLSLARACASVSESLNKKEAAAFFQHSIAVACCAEALAQTEAFSAVDSEEAFTVGLFHDIGIPAAYGVLQRQQQMFEGAPQYADQVIEEHHGAIGAKICRAWMLSDDVCQAVLSHAAEPSGHEIEGTLSAVVEVAHVEAFELFGEDPLLSHKRNPDLANDSDESADKFEAVRLDRKATTRIRDYVSTLLASSSV